MSTAPPLGRLLLPALLLPLAACLAPTAPQPVRIEHVVLCWLADPGNPTHRARVVAASEELASIPTVLTLHVGTALESEREIVDDSFDVGLVIGFADEAGLEAYLDHPDHLARVADVFGPLSARIIVYDVRR